MISIGASHNTCHLFLGKITVERKGWTIQGEASSVAIGWNTWIRSVIHHFQCHAVLKRKAVRIEYQAGAFCKVGQKNSDNVKVHFVAVPTNCALAVYVLVAVDEIINKAAIPFAAGNNIMKIDLPRFSEQREKFFRHILFCRNVLAVLLPSKKREDLCSACSCYNII